MDNEIVQSEEVARRGEELYDRLIRAHVETERNIGKLVSIDIDSGDYEIGDDMDVEAPLRLHRKHPGAKVYTRRIGYNAVFALGGTIERSDR